MSTRPPPGRVVQYSLAAPSVEIVEREEVIPLTGRNGESLPVELFGPIISFIPPTNKRALFSLMLVSRTISHEAEKRFYHTVRVHGSGWILRFLNTVTASPRLAPYVVHFYISVSPSREYIFDGFQGQLRHVLGLLINLKAFSYRAVRDRVDIVPDLFSQCRFRLHTLIWDRPRKEVALAELLRHQDQLRNLHVQWDHRLHSLISPDACPNLSYLCGNLGAMAVFLPHRRVVHLKWTDGPGHDYNIYEVWDDMAEWLARVRILQLMAAHQHLMPTEDHMHVFRGVQLLQLTLLTDEDAYALLKMPNLHTMMVTRPPDLPWPSSDLSTSRLFARFPTLQNIFTGSTGSAECYHIRRHEQNLEWPSVSITFEDLVEGVFP